jgi:parvulin-like peptidyl-prolyl isomerase
MASRILGWTTFFLAGLLSAGCQTTLPRPTDFPPPNPVAKPAQTSKAPDPDDGKSTVRTVSANLPETPNARVAVAVRAKVNSKAITEDELQLRMLSFPNLPDIMQMPEPRRSDTLQKILDIQLEQLIDREVIIQYSERLFKKNPKAMEKMKAEAAKEFDKKLRQIRKNAKVTSDDELKDMMRKQGLSLEALRRQTERDFIAKQFMMMKLMPAAMSVTFADVRDYFDTHKEEFQTTDRVEWQYMFIEYSETGKARHKTKEEARRFAEHLRQRIANGEDFLKLAQTFDDGFSKQLKSVGVGTKRGEIRPAELEGPVFDTKEGEVGPVVEAPSGFHAFRVVKREYAGQMAFDEKVQKRINNQLRNEAAGREYKRVMDELRAEAAIEVIRNPQVAAPAVAPPPKQ